MAFNDLAANQMVANQASWWVYIEKKNKSQHITNDD
jgi:predicted metal-dependent peptidase